MDNNNQEVVDFLDKETASKEFLETNHKCEESVKNSMMNSLIKYQAEIDHDRQYSIYFSEILPRLPLIGLDGTEDLSLTQEEINEFLSHEKFKEVLSKVLESANGDDITSQILTNKIHAFIVVKSLSDSEKNYPMSSEAKSNFEWYENIIFTRFRDNPESQHYMSKPDVISRFEKFVTENSIFSLSEVAESLDKELEKHI